MIAALMPVKKKNEKTLLLVELPSFFFALGISSLSGSGGFLGMDTSVESSRRLAAQLQIPRY